MAISAAVDLAPFTCPCFKDTARSTLSHPKIDGMDDYGNPRQSGQFNRNCENGRKPALDSQVVEKRKSEASIEPSITAKDSKSQQPRKNEVAVRLNKPETVDNGPVRPPKSTMQRKSNMEPKMQPKIENNTIPKKPPMIQKDKSKFSNEVAVQVKLEGFKRDGLALEARASEESKVNSSRDGRGEMHVTHVSNYSFGEAEALTDEVEGEFQHVGEVLRIRNVLLNFKEECDSVLFELLRRLQLMELTVDPSRDN
ncbi:uncharacterized protein LOC133300711 [Gastrolobium bilobum]|uniref:uncharacterized protein LOC133300711 n=1 Tax=Gastrolobium bilobum TaxID=150636 RepID=UPI002AB2B4B9|nr:uncharacterized protein LOC133300711 [Gastrolobium bilobum]